MSEPESVEHPFHSRRRAPDALSPPPFDHTAALQKYLKLLDVAIEWCLDEERYDRGGAAAIGARLIKASAAVGAALNQTPERQFTHRIVVEHIAPPHLPAKNLKTIHGGSALVTPQDDEAQPDEARVIAAQG